ncbi:hypothetical protein U27_03008 [Candidatus Vecturithrix granuli]|uniref:Uncharacterized protein n=1 Tax=Vecturithrix granuli TaxID=1499967 RepID=A0A081BUP1_VECG1|nr:hypothetical protein U27_03008 [Candidatus Vecturithrix granuli]
MIMTISGLLLLVVIGYIVIPFVAKNIRGVNVEQRNNLEMAIELEIEAFRKRDEETSLQAEE